jgi:hypothetical protein
MTVTSQDSTGMPLSITFGYDSDFGLAETSSLNNALFISWSMVGGNEFYAEADPAPGTLSIDSASEFTIDLDRSSTMPNVGTYSIELNVVLSYTNEGTDFVMDTIGYRFPVNVVGAAGSTVVSTGPGGIQFGPTDPTVEYGEDIVLRATFEDTTNVRRSLRGLVNADEEEEHGSIWVDYTEPIIVSSSTGGFDYIWPADAVSATSDTSGTGTTTLEIVLKQVPDDVFDLGSVFVKLPVRIKNNNGGEEDSAERLVVAKVDFAADQSSTTSMTSSSSASVPFRAVSAMAAGATILFSILC